MDLSAMTVPRHDRAVSGLTEANIALTRCGLCVALQRGLRLPISL